MRRGGRIGRDDVAEEVPDGLKAHAAANRRSLAFPIAVACLTAALLAVIVLLAAHFAAGASAAQAEGAGAAVREQVPARGGAVAAVSAGGRPAASRVQAQASLPVDPAMGGLVAAAVLAAVICAVFVAFYRMASRSERRLADECGRAEEALSRARDASSAKSEFLSRMSHEIRTPLNGIMGMTAIAQRSLGDDEKVRACLNEVEASSRHLLSLVNDVLDMSKVESGKLGLSLRPFDVRAFVAAQDAHFAAQARERGIAYCSQVAEDVPPLLEGDVLRLGQVVYNLVGNALKFTGAGGRVALRLQVAEGPGGGEPGAPETASGAAGGQAQWLRLSVEDTGCGIHPENVERIFDSFEQEDDQVARLHGGTGLGLAITKRLVELMGGAIGVESEVGRGSVFSAVLPFGACAPEAADAPAGGATAAGVAPACAMPEAAGVPTPETPEAADAPANVPPEAGSAPAPASASASAPASGQDSTPRPTQCPAPARPAALGAHGPLVGRRLLVVEDTPLNLEIARELLEMGGARVETATDGREALARFSASPPGHFDAVLMDVQMPVMDGYEATEALRALARPDARTVPVIALTARAFRQDEAESLSHGMDGHISKPLDARTIYDTINGFLDE